MCSRWKAVSVTLLAVVVEDCGSAPGPAHKTVTTCRRGMQETLQELPLLCREYIAVGQNKCKRILGRSGLNADCNYSQPTLVVQGFMPGVEADDPDH